MKKNAGTTVSPTTFNGKNVVVKYSGTPSHDGIRECVHTIPKAMKNESIVILSECLFSIFIYYILLVCKRSGDSSDIVAGLPVTPLYIIIIQQTVYAYTSSQNVSWMKV